MNKTFTLSKRVLISLLRIYILVCLGFFLIQSYLIFLPSNTTQTPPKNLGIKEEFISTSDGELLHAWYQDNRAAQTVLFFHGNAGNISDRSFQFKIFQKLKINALMIDYRSYGKSTGSIWREQDLYTDAQSALAFLMQEKGIKSKNIIVWGRSLGAAIATDIAKDKDFGAVILESPFYSLKHLAIENFYFLPVRFILRFPFRSDLKIETLKGNKLFIHSSDDETIPIEHGYKLYRKAKESKEFLEISGSHNTGFIESKEKYLEGIRNFLDKADKLG